MARRHLQEVRKPCLPGILLPANDLHACMHSHCVEHEWKLPDPSNGGKYSLFAVDDDDQDADAEQQQQAVEEKDPKTP